MIEPIYKARFYGGQAAGSNLSAQSVLPVVFELVGLPSSMLDVGCGVATWGRAARELGVDDYLGIDGDWVPREQLRVPQEQFWPTDLLQIDHLKIDRRFDLAICLEVAEHLPESAAAKLVKFLTAHADRVLFGAAVPGQGGTHHVNERWQSYWAEMFWECGFDPFDSVRPRIAGDVQIEYWYRQNTILYVRRDDGYLVPPRAQATTPRALDYILPELYEDKLRRIATPKLRELLRKIPVAFVSDLKRKLRRP